MAMMQNNGNMTPEQMSFMLQQQQMMMSMMMMQQSQPAQNQAAPPQMPPIAQNLMTTPKPAPVRQEPSATQKQETSHKPSNSINNMSASDNLMGKDPQDNIAQTSGVPQFNPPNPNATIQNFKPSTTENNIRASLEDVPQVQVNQNLQKGKKKKKAKKRRFDLDLDVEGPEKPGMDISQPQDSMEPLPLDLDNDTIDARPGQGPEALASIENDPPANNNDFDFNDAQVAGEEARKSLNIQQLDDDDDDWL